MLLYENFMNDATSSNSGMVKTFCQDKWEAIQKEYRQTEDKKIILSNFGDLSEDGVDSILMMVENKLESHGEPRMLIKRIFTVVVESLQNVRIHASRTESAKGTSFIIIAKEYGDYKVIVANLADNDIVEHIKAKLISVTALNERALKKVYMNSLAMGKLSAKGGAGLGILTIALKSDNNLKFNFEKINDDLTFFNMNIKVSAN